MSYNAFIKDAEAHYTKLRKKNAEKSEYYLSVLHSDKEYSSALEKYNFERFEFSKAKYLGDEESAKKHALNIENLKAEMRGVKARLKIDENMLLPTYTCTYCKDTGKTKDGKFCKCFKQFVKNSVCEKLGVKQRAYPDFAISSEKTENRLSTIYEKMSKYLDKFPNDVKTPIVFSGASGVGKTHLALSVAGALSEKGYNVIFLSAYELHSVFLKYASAPFDEKDDYISVLTDCDLLVIDDLGCEPILSNVSLQCLYNVINERTINKSPIIITTNLDAERIAERYGEALLSRILDRRNGVEVIISGEDLRLKNKI